MNETKQKHHRRRADLRACKRCDFRFETVKAKCPSCGMWNVPPNANDNSTDQTVLLSEVSPKPIARIESGPWDPCFSEQGGIVTTSVTLIGGAPGAGKSTMSLQLSDKIAEVTNREVIYVGTEETVPEIKNRAERLQLKSMHRIRMHPMGSSADLGNILQTRKPSAIILDSLPGLTMDPENAVEMCKRFKDYAVLLESPVIIIDHVTKQEDFAGLMQLQHAVDTLLTLFPIDEISRHSVDGIKEKIRELTTIKNRFGPANTIIEFGMTRTGLILENDNDEEDEDEDEDGEDE